MALMKTVEDAKERFSTLGSERITVGSTFFLKIQILVVGGSPHFTTENWTSRLVTRRVYFYKKLQTGPSLGGASSLHTAFS